MYKSKHTGKVIDERIDAMQYVTNPNLLDNWYFGNPVDHRGGYVIPKGTAYYAESSLTTRLGTTSGEYQSVIYGNAIYCYWVQGGATFYCATADAVRGYTGAGYTINRWKLSGTSATLLVDDDAIVLSATGAWNGGLDQVFEKPLPKGTYTVSLLAEEIEGSVAFIAFSQSDEWLANYGFYPSEDLHSFTFTTEQDIAHCIIVPAIANSRIKLKGLKLELGDIQTLAHQDASGNWVLNEIPNYHEELLKCIQSTADSNDTYANKVIATGYTCNKNLLDNWCFVNPVDQRGGYVVPPGVLYNDVTAGTSAVVTSYAKVDRFDGAGKAVFVYNGAVCTCAETDAVRGYIGAGYDIDRWRTGGNIAVCLLESCVVVKLVEQASGAYAYGWWQVLECADLVGKDVTLSALTDGSADFGIRMRFVNNSNAFVSAKELKGLSAGVNAISTVVPDGAAKLWVQVGNVANAAANSSLNIYAAKLELGDTQTLAHQDENGVWVLNEIPNYAEELAKCQRYYVALGNPDSTTVAGIGWLASAANKQVQIFVPLPTTLRRNPTVTFSGEISCFSPGQPLNPVTVIPTAIVSSNGINLILTLTNDVTQGLYFLRVPLGAKLIASADI